MAHLFIVDETTFKIHLEYMFAGTGAKEVPTDFIFDPNYKWDKSFSQQKITFNEKRSVDMMTDLCRIRKDDKIIFFVQKISKFYGIFKAKEDFFVDPNDKDNYLKNELGKILTYRILIEPDEVYEQGVTEFDFLDLLKDIEHPDQMCWSLIYRKLGANRGCTMITDAEFNLFKNRLSSISNNKRLNSSGFSYDKQTQKITETSIVNNYHGNKKDVNQCLYNNMYARYTDCKAFEHYLQYLTISILKSTDYKDILKNNQPVTWIGNEVMCSVGEHRIDAFAIQETDKVVDISIIELKQTTISKTIIQQLAQYIYWVKYYISPTYLRKNKQVNIYPIIISSDSKSNARDKTKQKLKNLEQEVIKTCWHEYNDTNVTVNNTRIIHFIDNGNAIIIPKKSED